MKGRPGISSFSRNVYKFKNTLNQNIILISGARVRFKAVSIKIYNICFNTFIENVNKHIFYDKNFTISPYKPNITSFKLAHRFKIILKRKCFCTMWLYRKFV